MGISDNLYYEGAFSIELQIQQRRNYLMIGMMGVRPFGQFSFRMRDFLTYLLSSTSQKRTGAQMWIIELNWSRCASSWYIFQFKIKQGPNYNAEQTTYPAKMLHSHIATHHRAWLCVFIIMSTMRNKDYRTRGGCLLLIILLC